MRVIIVGGGIMGLSTAMALVRDGHRVTVFDQGAIPNPHGSSVDQHRLIRHAYGPMTGYARMIDGALAAWGRMWQALDVSCLHPTGTLVLAREDLTWAEVAVDEMKDQGIPTELLTRDGLETRYPWLDASGVELAVLIDSGGVLMAEEIVRRLARHLLMRGVTMNTHTPVIDIDPVRGTVTLEDGSSQRADRVIIAAGPWVRDLVPSSAGRVKPSRQVVAYLTPPERLRTAWESAPMVLDIHGAGGIYVVPPVAGSGLKVGDHSFSLKGHPGRDRVASEAEGRTLLEACRERLSDLDEYGLGEIKTCFYTVQKEEAFIIDSIERAVLMTGFSGHGFKFGALMGEMIAGLVGGRITSDEARRLAAGAVFEHTEIARLTSLCRG